MPRRAAALPILLALLPAALGAQQVARTIYVADGEGRLLTGDGVAAQEITRVEATLYQNGGLELGLFKGRNRWVFMGTWSGDPVAGSVGLRLDEAFDRAADGTGRLYLDRTAVERLRFSGSNRDGRFDFTFEGRTSGRDDGPAAEAGEVATTRNGEGTITTDTTVVQVTRARVRLYKNGRAQLRMWGTELYTVDGRWTGSLDAASVRLSVPEWEDDEADLRGTVALSRRNGWDRVVLEGPTDRGPVKIEFTGRSVALEYDDSGPLVTGVEKTMRGTGTLMVNGVARDQAVLVRAHLKRNWEAVVQVQGEKERFAFAGTWLQRGQEPKLSLDLTSGSLGRGTAGTGSLEMSSEERWRTLTLSGRQGTGSWALTFRATDGARLLFDPGDEGTPALVAELSTEKAGTGTLALPNQAPRAVRKLRVALKPGQDAEVTIVEGDTTATLTGRWQPGERPGRVELALTGGTLKGFRGTGKLDLDDALGLARLTIEGRVVTLRTRLEFTAQGAPPPRR